MSGLLSLLPEGLRAISGPERIGSEQRWRVELADGRRAQFGVLLPELARDESIRRRYVRDVERLRELDVDGLAPILDHGPDASPPWRLRLDPAGETLAAWLERRAPAPIDEVSERFATIAELVHRVHAAGAVLRDLHPRGIVLADDRVWLTDVGLARVDILSTRTAASLVLEGSAYAAPEQLRRTTLDQRSDLFALGVMLYHALTGSLPFGEGPSFLRDDSRVLAPVQLRPDLPVELDALVQACLAADPRARPESAASLAHALRGETRTIPGQALARVTCQSCGGLLRVGQRLCLACGKQSVLFQHAATPEQATKRLTLVKVREDADFLARLRDFLESVSADRVPSLDFVHGDQRMYSKTELARRIKLPVTLFSDLDDTTAEALRVRMSEQEFAVKVADKTSKGLSRGQRKGFALAGGVVLAMTLGLALLAPLWLTIGLASAALIMWFVSFAIVRQRARQTPAPALLALRSAPAALPASDPLVARLAALLGPQTPHDLREQVGELALLVQRLVDHRAGLADGRELDMVSEPVEPLVGLIEHEVRSIASLDLELAPLDEGALVRALATSEARGEPKARREPLLVGLDRLRTLEELRAKAFHRLLEASSLIRRSVDLGLDVRDGEAEHERNVALALHALEHGQEP